MPADTAADQLQRILFILPAACRGGAPIAQLAAALDVDVHTVMADIEQVTSRVFYHPAGATEPFSILIEHDSVEVHARHEFTRPVRLSEREALALGLGLRCLASDADAAERARILQLAERLEASLTAPDTFTAYDAIAPRLMVSADRIPFSHADGADDADAPIDDVEYDELTVALDDDGFRGVVADAIDLRRTCSIWYLRPGDVGPTRRSLAPYRLIYAEGRWYVAAWDLDREALRFFRMDRILDASLDEDAAPAVPAAELDALLRSGVPYSATDDVEVRVRYSPRVARWIVEQTAAPLEADGSVVLSHRVADTRWLVRHVLQYGGEAVVEAPEEARRWVWNSAADVAGV